MTQKPIWSRQEREAAEHMRQLLLAQPDGGAALLRKTVAALSADTERRELEVRREECEAMLGRMSDAARRLADALPRQTAVFSGAGFQNERCFLAYCAMMRELEADVRGLDGAALAVSSVGHTLAKRVPAFLRAELLCRTAMAMHEICPAAEQALGELAAKQQEAETLAEQIRFLREAVERFCRQSISEFRTRAEALADAEHRGAGLRPAALAALCGDFIHAAMALAGQVRQNAATDARAQGCPNP